MFASSRIPDLFGVEVPILQAPMAGAQNAVMAIDVSNAGALGALPCGTNTPAQALAEAKAFRVGSGRSMNMNFFCHDAVLPETESLSLWHAALADQYAAYGVDAPKIDPTIPFHPFGPEKCEVVEAIRPEVVSFHFGLPSPSLLKRVRATGVKIICTATTIAEALFLETEGVDAIIAQGVEAGGHRGMFLSNDISRQMGTFALVRGISERVQCPVIAAGGIADGKGIAAAFRLGAEAVQIGTRFLKTPASIISDHHRALLEADHPPETALTNVFSGRPARSFVNRAVADIGPMNPSAPPFPLAGGGLKPLVSGNEGSEFSSLWAGQASSIGAAMPVSELVALLVSETTEALA